MLSFDKKRRTYSMSLNWMGKHVTIPVFMIGPRSRIRWDFHTERCLPDA